MSRDVNWWLISLAFLLGLLLTLALTIRKVTREVPVHQIVEVPKHHVGKSEVGKVAGAVTATAAGAAAALHDAADKVETKVEHFGHKAADKVSLVGHKHTGSLEDVEDVLEREPYGVGSIRVSARTAAPAGYTIKGDKDTGRYFTVDSPQYASIGAEVWFANEESAEKAGFVRWDAAGRRRVGLVSPEAAAVVTEGHHVEADTVVTEAPHLPAETVVNEDDSEADASLVVIDDGIPEAEARGKIVDGD
jgi:uncharacterized membrane protein ArfC